MRLTPFPTSSPPRSYLAISRAAQASCSRRASSHQHDLARLRPDFAVILWLFARGNAHDFDGVADHVSGAFLAFMSIGHYVPSTTCDLNSPVSSFSAVNCIIIFGCG